MARCQLVRVVVKEEGLCGVVDGVQMAYRWTKRNGDDARILVAVAVDSNYCCRTDVSGDIGLCRDEIAEPPTDETPSSRLGFDDFGRQG